MGMKFSSNPIFPILPSFFSALICLGYGVFKLNYAIQKLLYGKNLNYYTIEKKNKMALIIALSSFLFTISHVKSYQDFHFLTELFIFGILFGTYYWKLKALPPVYWFIY